jgi:hypothetical protein
VQQAIQGRMLAAGIAVAQVGLQDPFLLSAQMRLMDQADSRFMR